MKMDLLNPNPNLWDHVAYRVMFTAHPRTGNAWCIYPTYDYTHCIVDSLENITHSICTLEFETRQASDGSYYWLLDALDLYKPVTWEFSRCNVTYGVMSKRKLNLLVIKGYVNGWDDPRLLTLDGLRRRGYTPDALNSFCTKIGVTRAANTSRMQLLESCIREELDDTVERRFGVLYPLKVTITGLSAADARKREFRMMNHPKKPEMGAHMMPFDNVVYIEREDFREVDEKGYYGLAPGKEVHLKYGPYITCTEVIKDGNGNVVELKAEEIPETKVKGHLHWVAAATAVEATINLYDYLFTKEMPEAVDEAAAEAADDEGQDDAPAASGGFLENLNPDSLISVEGLVEPELAKDAGEVNRSFQFERMGFFTVDNVSTVAKPVFNRVVTLKESKCK